MILWLLGGAYLIWWVGANPLPDGFQNEYLLVGNAYDLWGALTDGDIWHLRWFMYTGYWPWGLYAVPWPFMAVLGPGHLALVLGNLIHLGVLLVAAKHIGQALGGRYAPLLVVLCPGVFGSLVRFEPNLAVIAWTGAGLAALVGSRKMESRRHMWAFGAAFGIGLMMDRLSVAFFLLPALVPLAWRMSKRATLHLCQALGITAILTGAYCREFFIRHSHELFSQVGTGEIDSAGTLTEVGAMIEWAYYPLTLLDSQAGIVLGGAMLVAVFTRRCGAAMILWASMAGGVLFFSLISKHQVFYTLPVLVPLAAFLSAKPRLAIVGIAGGLWSFASVGLDLVPAGPRLDETWVSPRHTVARPPIGIDIDLAPVLSALASPAGQPPAHVSVLSEDHRLFEGFLLLAVRERWPNTPSRGVVTDPHGTFEMFNEVDALLWVGPKHARWPTAQGIEKQLREDNVDPDSMPPAARVVAASKASFIEVGRWSADETQDAVVFRRR